MIIFQQVLQQKGITDVYICWYSHPVSVIGTWILLFILAASF